MTITSVSEQISEGLEPYALFTETILKPKLIYRNHRPGAPHGGGVQVFSKSAKIPQKSPKKP